jgi:hypothetical protein
MSQNCLSYHHVRKYQCSIDIPSPRVNGLMAVVIDMACSIYPHADEPESAITRPLFPLRMFFVRKSGRFPESD